MAKYIPIGEPANQSEADALRRLRDALPDHFVVIGNFELQLPNRPNTFEYDAVVLGEYGIYAVEIKGWGGEIRGDLRRWHLDWGEVQNPLILTERKAKALRSFIWQEVPSLPRDVFCKAVVMLPAKTRLAIDGSRGDHIVTAENVYDFFVDVDRIRAQGPGALLDSSLRNAIERTLLPLASPTTSVPRIREYEIIGEPVPREDVPYREFIGRHRLLRSRSRVRIKMYSLDPLVPSRERQSEYERILRDMEALTRLDSNPYVANGYEVIRDQDHELNFYLVSEWIGRTTLGDFIRRYDYSKGLDLPRRFAAHLLRAVAFMHGQGIVHRNLSPEVIYIPENTIRVPLKIADFDYARVVQLPSIGGGFDRLGTEGYCAPEMWQAANYDHRVDVFSCGAIIFELLTGSALFDSVGELLEPAAHWEQRRLEIEDEGMREALDGLLAPDPDRRTIDLEAVVAAFEIE